MKNDWGVNIYLDIQDSIDNKTEYMWHVAVEGNLDKQVRGI